MAKKWKVIVREYERGWGTKIDEVREFDDWDAADAFAKHINSQNNKATVPYIYWTADAPVRITGM